MGLTKIFFRAGMLALLEGLRTRRINELVTLVQKNIRRRIAYKQYQTLKKNTIQIQAWWRGILGRRFVEDLRRQTAAIKIQRTLRGYLQRKKYLQTRNAVVKIQSSESVTSDEADDQLSEDTKRESELGRRKRYMPLLRFKVCSVDCEWYHSDSADR